MKKLFLLIPVLLFAITAKAIAPGTKALYNAYAAAEAGATIVLEAGTYDETERIIFTKDITIMAAEGAEVIVKPHKDNQIKEGAKVKFIGIKFDGSEMSTYEYFIRSYDATAGKELRFEKCEMTGFTGQYLINAANADRTLDSVIINDCKCVNNGKDAIYIAAGSDTQETAKGVIVKNSTFANFAALAHSVIEVDNYGSTKTPNIEVTVDHCTFYNNPTTASGYADIRVYKSTKVAISNCIFAHPEEYARCGTYCYGGTISNCLSYNLTSGTKGHRADDINLSTCLPNADPLFADAANGDFSLANNWKTMSISPACGAATDGSDLGDPRWHSDPDLPETDFATPYVFAPDKAKLSGRVSVSETNLLWDNNSDASLNGSATWKIHATRACYLSATINNNASNTSGHRFSIQVLDADGNSIGDPLAEPADSWSHVDDVLSGQIHLPAAGNYTVILSNATEWSKALLSGITLSYSGGAVTDISPSANTTLNIIDALFSGCTRTADYIQYPSSGTSSAWIKWNIATSATKMYDVSVNINTEYAHGFTVAIYEDEDADPVASITEGSYVNTKGSSLTLELGRVNLVGGKNFVVKVTNAPSGSQAKVTSVAFAPVAAATTELPNTLAFSNAILSEKAHVTDGKLYFNEIGDKDPVGQWARWNVTTDHNGTFLFTLDTYSSNGQSYKISIYDDGDNLIDSFEKKLSSGTAGTIKHYFVLASGNYSVKVENTTAWSRGYLTSFVVTEPSLLTLNDTDESNSTIVDNYRTGALDIKITRTIVAGMYNTICLPFDVDATLLKEVFGNDVDVRVMSAATIEGEVLSLNFNANTSISRGTPYLIKTSSNIVNPIFVDVEIKVKVGDATGGDAADYIGTFIQQDITANENNLFLGSENKLYFSTEDVTIKGFRGYFNITASGSAPKRVRLVMDEENIATEIELVNGQLPEILGNKVLKTIEDGQLFIQCNGIRYNVMGQIVK